MVRGTAVSRRAALAERTRDERFAALVAELSEEQRAVIHLHYWMGHTVTEIVELLGMVCALIRAWLRVPLPPLPR